MLNAVQHLIKGMGTQVKYFTSFNMTAGCGGFNDQS